MHECSNRVTLCADGKYRWMYEYSMLKNPVILLTVLKIFLLCDCAPALVVTLSSLRWEGLGALLSGIKVYGLVALITVPVALLAYGILAGIYGWKYIVLFEMDEDGITHIQQAKQFTKAQGMAWLLAFSGAARNNPALAGTGLSVSAKNACSSDFRLVKSVRSIPRWDTVKLNQPLSRNQVYADKEDYRFVRDYIVSRCTKAKIR